MFLVFLQAAASMLRQSGFFSYSCCTALILKIASPTASISWSLSSSNDSNFRQKVSSVCLAVSAQKRRPQAHFRKATRSPAEGIKKS